MTRHHSPPSRASSLLQKLRQRNAARLLVINPSNQVLLFRGLHVDSIGTSVSERSFAMMLPSGESVLAVERYFIVRANNEQLTRDGWTADEARVMTDHKWWSVADLQETSETVWPERLIEMLENA